MTTVTTSTSSTGLTPDTPVLETSQMGFSNLEFTMNSTATSTVPLSVARRASNGSDNVTVANIGGGVVTIKQEPFTNHEEEMEAQSGECLSVYLVGGWEEGGGCDLSVKSKRLGTCYMVL